MSCSNITQGISKGCNNNLGGIKNIYISEQTITGYVLQYTTGIVVRFDPSNATWLTIEADQGTGNFTETYEINQMGGIIAFKQSVTFQINDLSAYNQQRIQELAESTNLGVVVEMNNGKFFTVGIERGAYLETGSTGSGTAYGDLSGSTITITGMEQISSLEVNPVAIGQTNNTLIIYQWRIKTPCQQNPIVQLNDIRLGPSAENAKCEWDDMSAYLLADPEGCNPQSDNITNAGNYMHWAKNETLGVGTQVYLSNGNPQYEGWFWYAPDGLIRAVGVPGAYTGFESNPNMYIGKSESGVITYFEYQTNVTC